SPACFPEVDRRYKPCNTRPEPMSVGSRCRAPTLRGELRPSNPRMVPTREFPKEERHMRPRAYPVIGSVLAVLVLLVSMAVSAISVFAQDQGCQPQISVDRPAANTTVRGVTTIS